MRTQFIMASIFWLMATITFNAYSAPGESIVLDPNTGDYLITYYGTGALGNKKNKILRKEIFVPATKIDPSVKSTFKLKEDGTIVYKYQITNGSKSKQPLVMLMFDPVTSIIETVPMPIRDPSLDAHAFEQIYLAGKAALTTPDGWGGTNFEKQVGKLRISWVYENLDSLSDGLAQGTTQTGFGFSSKDIPGIGIAQLRGHSPGGQGYVDEGPSGEIGDQVFQLEQNNYVSRNAAVPTIPVPTPFDPAVILERIQTQMHTWIAMNLLDAAFASQLDRYFQSAISAYRLNQPKVGKQQIEAMRELIKKEQPDLDRDEEHESDNTHEKNDVKKPTLIARLAARVLDFDLKYVTKRMGGDKDD